MQKLNGYPLNSVQTEKNFARFNVSEASMSDIVALDGQTFTVTEDEKDYMVFSGYAITGLQAEGDSIIVEIRKELDDATKETLNDLEINLNLLSTRVSDTETVANDAKDYALYHGASTSMVKAIEFMTASSVDIPNSKINDLSDLIPDWQPDISYKQGQIVKYDNKVYRLAQDTTSSDIFKPGVGTESIYTLIDIAEDGVRVWHMPTGATDSFALGELAHYPTASDPIYRSKRNGNTSEPTKDEWWELDE